MKLILDSIDRQFEFLPFKSHGERIDELVLSVAKDLREKIDFLKSEQLSADKNALQEEAAKLFNRIEQLSDSERDRLHILAYQIQFIEELPNKLASAQEVLTSLALIRMSPEYSEARNLISDNETSHQMRILIYYLWMLEDIKALINGKRVPKSPFSCEVGSRKGRDEHCEEFYVLLHFLPLYFQQTGIALLPVRKSETPDFIVVNAVTDEISGIEIGEAVQAEKNENRAAEERWIAEIKAIPQLFGASFLFVSDPPFPKKLRDLKKPFLNFLVDAIKTHRETGKRRYVFRNNSIALTEILVSDSGIAGQASIAFSSGNADWLDTLSGTIVDSVVDIISSKVEGKEPSIKSMLVLYPNDDASAEAYRNGAVITANRIGQKVVDRFYEIWLVKETAIWKISP